MAVICFFTAFVILAAGGLLGIQCIGGLFSGNIDAYVGYAGQAYVLLAVVLAWYITRAIFGPWRSLVSD